MRGTLMTMAALALLGGCAAGQKQSASRDRDAGAATFDAASGQYGDGATKAGAAKDCVQVGSIRSTSVRGDRVIDFEMNGREIYRNVLPNSCPQLGFEERFAYATSLSQLCSVDTVTVLLSPGLSRGATCGLGSFQPIKPPVGKPAK